MDDLFCERVFEQLCSKIATNFPDPQKNKCAKNGAPDGETNELRNDCSTKSTNFQVPKAMNNSNVIGIWIRFQKAT